MIIRKAFVMSVNAGSEEEYAKRHTPIWPELERVLKEHGVSNYSIFCHPEASQLFGYAEIESETQWAAIGSTEIYKQWWKQMADLMPSNAEHSPPSLMACWLRMGASGFRGDRTLRPIATRRAFVTILSPTRKKPRKPGLENPI